MKQIDKFSEAWDIAYKNQTHKSSWPWTDLVSTVYKHLDTKSNKKILELGCGYGANIPFFNTIALDYYGIDGSDYVVENLISRFPELSNNIKSADFSESIPFDIKFDYIFDRGALICNSTSGIKKTIQLIKKHLKKDGLYMGIDWYAIDHDEFTGNNGVKVDAFTKDEFNGGPFDSVGRVHFNSKEHLMELFEGFTFKYLMHKTKHTFLPSEKKHTYWDFIVVPS